MHTHVSVKTAYTLFLFSILTIVLVQILEGLYSDIASGGNGWRQGDWLINNEHQLVRRGIFGSLIFGVSDYLSISPLTLLGIIQGVILVFIFSVVIVFVARLGANTRILWLVLSPAFVLMFWFLDFGNTFRKEVLVYFSFSILMLDIIIKSKRSIIIWISSLFFIFSVFSHEGNFFSLPFFLAALNIAYGDLANKQKYLLMSIVIIGSLGSLGYAIAFSESPDPTLVCRALLQRQLPEHLCDGAISYLDQDVNYAFDFMKSQVLQSGLYRSYTIAYFLSLMPLLFIRPLLVPRKIYFFAVFFGVVPFLPLFIIAIDWGRWINFYVTSITMIFLMHMNLRPHLYPLKVSNSISFKLFAFLHCFLWNMPNCCRQIEWGAVAVVKQMAAKLLVDA